MSKLFTALLIMLEFSNFDIQQNSFQISVSISKFLDVSTKVFFF